jgi:hypothetical protein
MNTTVINVRSGQPYDVYIGRGSDFGNPYIIGTNGTRLEVIELYKSHLVKRLEDPEFRENFLTLRGKVLACHCKPLACHGDAIIEALGALA